MRPCVPGRKVDVMVSLCIDHANSFSCGPRRSRPVVSATRSRPQSLVGLSAAAKPAVIAAMRTKSREVIWGGRVSAACLGSTFYYVHLARIASYYLLEVESGG
jgi:hypothetical protein